MTNNNQSRQQVRTNRFGEAEVLTACTAKIDKKSGEVLPIFKGYIEIKGDLYKFEISNANTPAKDGRPRMWLKATKKAKQAQNRNQSF